MIFLKNIQKTYQNGVLALSDVNLHISKKDVFGIIGYSGAGKSTLLRLINRIEEPSSGDVVIQGQSILDLKGARLRRVRQKIGMIFQNFNLISSKNVFENVAFSLRVAGSEGGQIGPRVSKLLRLVGLEDKANSYPSQLSGGQKQRVAIARALVNEPDILLCDEATSALDPKTAFQIVNLLRSLQEHLGLTIVLITHQIAIASSICNKLCFISNGRILESGDKDYVLKSAQVAEFLKYDHV